MKITYYNDPMKDIWVLQMTVSYSDIPYDWVFI